MTTVPFHPLYSLLDVVNPVKIVDIGASAIDGPPCYAPLLKAGYAQVVGFEPNLVALAELNQRKGASETYLRHAVGDGRRHSLRHCWAPGMTSLLEPNSEVLALFHGFSEWGRVVRTEEIDTLRLDDIPETADLDMLKLDIQGAELMVLENATERLKSTLVIHTEVEFLQMYVGQPLFSDIERFLRQHGFVLHRFVQMISRAIKPMMVGNDPRAGLSQLFWADAVLVRDFVHVERLTPDQLLRTAAILHDCYQSYDLVLHLLLEHDRRTGLAYAKKFLHAIGAAQ